jgi:hypothetical protein
MTASKSAGTHLQEVNFDVSYSVAPGVTKQNTATNSVERLFYARSRQIYVLVSYWNCQQPFTA